VRFSCPSNYNRRTCTTLFRVIDSDRDSSAESKYSVESLLEQLAAITCGLTCQLLDVCIRTDAYIISNALQSHGRCAITLYDSSIDPMKREQFLSSEEKTRHRHGKLGSVGMVSRVEGCITFLHTLCHLLCQRDCQIEIHLLSQKNWTIHDYFKSDKYFKLFYLFN